MDRKKEFVLEAKKIRKICPNKPSPRERLPSAGSLNRLFRKTRHVKKSKKKTKFKKRGGNAPGEPGTGRLLRPRVDRGHWRGPEKERANPLTVLDDYSKRVPEAKKTPR